MAGDIKMTGIYKITQKNTGMAYVGSSVSVFLRWGTHISNLLGGTHDNKSLQKDFDQYGLASLVFEILEFLPFANNKELLNREGYWLNTTQADGVKCYNVVGLDLAKEGVKEACALCDNPVYARMMCQEHYYQARRLSKHLKGSRLIVPVDI